MLPAAVFTLLLQAAQAAGAVQQPAPGEEKEKLVEESTGFFKVLMNPEEWAHGALELAPHVGRALIVLVFFWGLYISVRTALQKVLERSRLDPALTRLLLFSFLRWAFLFMAIVMAAGELGFNVTAALAGLGVAGIAVGLAAQDTIANVIAGITIFLDRPFKVGDWVTSGGITGLVAEIKVRSTRIRTRNNTFMVVPNKQIVDSVIVNHSLYGDVRVDIPIGIAYKESVREARRVILDAISGIDLILEGRSDVVLDALGDSSQNLVLRVWVDDPYKETFARFECLEAVKVGLDAAGIQIPFPHLQLFFDKIEDQPAEALRRALAR